MTRMILIVLGVLVAIWLLALGAQKAIGAEGTITAVWDEYTPPLSGSLSVIDADEQASASGCGRTYKARWKTQVKGNAGQLDFTINWRQGYCIRPYPHYGLTWVGKLKPTVEIGFWGDATGWEYRGVEWSKDGYFDGGFRHSSIKWLVFKQCVGIPTGKLCHTTKRIGRRMVVDGFGNNQLFAL